MVDQIQEINKKNNWDFVPGAGNATEDQLPLDMTFNHGHVVSIVTYTILMVLSAVANITVLLILLKRRRRSRHSSMINTLLMNLAIADLMVTFLMMPLEIGWNVTVSWRGGDALCRIMAFFRIFGLYLSGFVLMCISMDRYYAVLKPLSLSQIKRRGKIMLVVSWAASTICSAPQIAIFHVENHPNFTYYQQCVTFNFFQSEWQDLVYKYFGLIMMYGLPLIVIVFCYSSILTEIYKKYKDCKSGTDLFRRPSAGFLGRARIRTLKMTVTIVMGFLICWTPYYVMCLWYWMDKDSAQKVDQRIQKGLFIFASGNSIMNPIVYLMFNVSTKPPEKEKVITQPTIPDVINADPGAVAKRSLKDKVSWRFRCHRSFSSERQDLEEMKMSSDVVASSTRPVVKPKRFRWHLKSQRSFSSEGGDMPELSSSLPEETSVESSLQNCQTSADIRRYNWQMKHQASVSEDINQGKPAGWRSWLSHQHVDESDQENEIDERVTPNQTQKASNWSAWLSKGEPTPGASEKGMAIQVSAFPTDDSGTSVT